MPKLEPKIIQKELESGAVWPVYWLYGQEQMKSRELLKRIKKTVLGDNQEGSQALFQQSFNEELLDGSEVSASQVVDAAQSLSLGGGTRLIIIRDAHAMKDTEVLVGLMGPKAKKDELSSVCVFLSKDLDARKKFSKSLLEKAAVVPCEEIAEEDREAWIGYLGKKRGLELSPDSVARLRFLDPWNLDIVDQELEKMSLAKTGEDASAVLLGSVGPELGGDAFLNAFFARDLKQALLAVENFADRPDESLPLLGLLTWNARYLALVIHDHQARTREVKLNPFLLERFNYWARGWSLTDAIELQEALAELDFGIKQTQRLPLGLWTDLVARFCR